jgi:hypothetical protein
MTRSTDSRGLRWLGLSACTALLCTAVLVADVHNASAADSGRLRLVQVLQDGKDGVEGLFGPAFSALSPDGAHVYVTVTGETPWPCSRAMRRPGG